MFYLYLNDKYAFCSDSERAIMRMAENIMDQFYKVEIKVKGEKLHKKLK